MESIKIKKARLGARLACSVCGIRFYDLNRPNPTCPKCGSEPIKAQKKVTYSRSTVLDIDIDESEVIPDDDELVPLDGVEEDMGDYSDEDLG